MAGAPDPSTIETNRIGSGVPTRSPAQMILTYQQREFEAAVRELFAGARDVLLRKHHDYGPTNISQSPGGPLNGLRVRMWDKTARINNLIDSGATPENESLRDSFLDLANYALIGVLVLDGDWPE